MSFSGNVAYGLLQIITTIFPAMKADFTDIHAELEKARRVNEKNRYVFPSDKNSLYKEIAFDKTGTLTYGTPEVVAVGSILTDWSQEEIYRLTASAERFSEHPIGKAIVTSYKKSGGVPDAAADFQMIPGRGVCAGIQGRSVYPSGGVRSLMSR